MVMQMIWPKEGGGSLRRFLGIRRNLLNNRMNDSRRLKGPMTLFDFRRRDDAADLRDSLSPDRMRGLFGGWRVSDDSVIGGASTSNFGFRNDCNDHDENNTQKQQQQKSPPFLRWTGTISTEINQNSQLARNITRSGFAAILSPEYPLSAPLGAQFRALEICCRTDGRTYAVNLHVETMFPEDMYQGFISGQTGQQTMPEVLIDTMNDADSEFDKPPSLERGPRPSLDVRKHMKNRQQFIQQRDPNNHPYHGHPPAGFQRLILPFDAFALTSRGRLRQQQRDLDGAVNIESIGFTLMDGQDGDFCFDLVSLRAVNVVEGEVVGTLEDEAREEELRKLIKPEEGGGKEDEDEGADVDDDESEQKPEKEHVLTDVRDKSDKQ